MEKMARNAILKRVEKRRTLRGLTQAQVAASCGFSQGQYSKMLRKEASVGARCAQSMKAWLSTRPGAAAVADPLADGTALKLIESIRRDMSLLAAMVSAMPKADGSPQKHDDQ